MYRSPEDFLVKEKQESYGMRESIVPIVSPLAQYSLAYGVRLIKTTRLTLRTQHREPINHVH